MAKRQTRLDKLYLQAERLMLRLQRIELGLLEVEVVRRTCDPAAGREAAADEAQLERLLAHNQYLHEADDYLLRNRTERRQLLRELDALKAEIARRDGGAS